MHAAADGVSVVPEPAQVVGDDVVAEDLRESVSLERQRSQAFLDVHRMVQDVVVAFLPALDHEAVLDDVGRTGSAGGDRIPALVEIASPDGRQPAVREDAIAIGVVEVTILDQVSGTNRGDPVADPGDLQLLKGPECRILGEHERLKLPRS